MCARARIVLKSAQITGCLFLLSNLNMAWVVFGGVLFNLYFYNSDIQEKIHFFQGLTWNLIWSLLHFVNIIAL